MARAPPPLTALRLLQGSSSGAARRPCVCPSCGSCGSTVAAAQRCVLIGESAARGLGDGGRGSGGHVAFQRPGAALAPGCRRPSLNVMAEPVRSCPARQLGKYTRKATALSARRRRRGGGGTAGDGFGGRRPATGLLGRSWRRGLRSRDRRSAAAMSWGWAMPAGCAAQILDL